MNDIARMLQRQAEWQRSRQSLTWPEKLRMVEAVRESIQLLRRTGPARAGTPTAPARPRHQDPT